MRVPVAPTINNPVLYDSLIIEMQTKLTSAFTWLSHAFPQAQNLVKMIDDKEYRYPAIFIGVNEYWSVLPTDDIGCFSFFKLDESDEVEWFPNLNYKLKTKFSLIFFFNLQTIYPTDKARRMEDVKSDIIKKLTEFHCKNGSFTITEINSDAKKIYEDYSIDEVSQQFMMHPYGALKFSGEMEVQIRC